MSTPSSALTRYRPLVLSITGFAAIYGIYLVYNIERPSSGTPLHRSGAIRRRSRTPRPRSAHPVASTLRELVLDPTLTYGHFEFPNSNGDRTLMDLRADRLPTLETFFAEGHNAVAAQLYVDQAQSIYLDRFFAVVLGPAEIAATQDGTPVNREGMRSWLGAIGIAESNIARSLLRFDLTFNQFTNQRLLAEGDEDALTLANIYNRGGNSVPATEVGVHHRQPDTEGQNLKQLLYYIAEEQSKQEGYVHRGVSCNLCDTKPLRGTRWRCANCADFDLCNDCHSVGTHSKTHIFYEIKVPGPFVQPLQSMPVAYPGNPDIMPRSLPQDVCKRLVNETTYEKAEVEGLYDQFTCIASYRWPTDPNKIGAAIDRRSFESALFSVTSLNPPKPNLIYDRIFSLYDSNADGLIGFEEFVRGLACLHNRSKDHNQRLRKVFDGYDVDGDGYVSRRDFLRIFRAFYAIQKELVRDLLLVQQEELTVEGAMKTINSSMPLSSAFTGIQIPSRSQDAPEGKIPDRFGDMRTAKNPVLDSADDTIDRTRIITNSVHFAHEGQPTEDVREAAIRDRWQRRRFYTDEEEGAHLVNGAPEHIEGSNRTVPDLEDDDGVVNYLPSPALHHTPEKSQPTSPRSRSSSKVRFQDDVDFETRSNGSTSSRPLNERYGGYEMPQAEKDCGREILYQVIEEGMNELLDPFFKWTEDLAMQVDATKLERRKWKAEIAAFKELFQAQDELTPVAAQDPLLATAEAVLRKPQNSSFLDDMLQLGANHGSEAAISQIEQRINLEPLEELLRTNGHSLNPTPGVPTSPTDTAIAADSSPEIDRLGPMLRTQPDRVSSTFTRSPESSRTSGNAVDSLDAFQMPERLNARYDPTMPQFRLNSDHEPRTLGYDQTQIAQGSSSPRGRHWERPSMAPANAEPYDCELDREPISLPSQSEQSANGATSGSDHATVERFTSVVFGSNNAVLPEKDSSDAQNGAKTPNYDSPPSATELRMLAIVDEASREMDTRGGPGRLSFVEFEKLMKNSRKEGRQLSFVEEWLDLGGF